MREWHSLLSTLRMRGPPPPTPLAYRPSRLAQIVSALFRESFDPSCRSIATVGAPAADATGDARIALMCCSAVMCRHKRAF